MLGLVTKLSRVGGRHLIKPSELCVRSSLKVFCPDLKAYSAFLKVSKVEIKNDDPMIQIANRAAHLREVIPIVFFNERKAAKRQQKAVATIILLVKLKVSFLLQFLQFHPKKRNLKSTSLLYSDIEYL
jgi:hypothetical protein